MKNLLYKPLLHTLILVVCIIGVIHTILPGFTKVNTIYINDYVISEKEEEMTIQIINSSSAGYVRKVKTTEIDNQLYLDFYKCFGGINGSIGAKHEFVISLNENIEIILLNIDKDTYKYVLEKNANGTWVRSK